MPNICRKLWSTMLAAFRTTPVEVIICIASAFVISLAIEDFFGSDAPEFVPQILMTAALVGLVSFSASIARELKIFDSRTRWLLTGSFGSAAIAYGAFVFDPEVATELWRWAFLAAGAAAVVTLVPVASRLGEATASERFWRFNMRLLFRFAIAGTYATLLFAGLSVGLVAIDELFGIHMNDDIFGHLFAWTVLAGGGVLAAGGLKDAARIDAGVSEDGIYWGARLGTWLFLPLLTLYLLIMYAYLGQVVTGTTAPSNVLSPLALGAGIIGYLGLFVLHPIKERAGSRSLTLALKAFPAAFIPLVPLGLWAVAERVQQYGWTEFRYARVAALVCLGVYSLIGAWKWARGREFSLVSGPAIVATVALLSAVGPWSASTVSFISQKDRMMEKLAEHDALNAEGMLRSPEELSKRPRGDYYSEMYYLLDAHGPYALADLTDQPLDERDNVYDQLSMLGVTSNGVARYLQVYRPYDDSFQISSTGEMFEISISDGSPERRDFTRFELDALTLQIERGDRRLTGDLGSLIPDDDSASSVERRGHAMNIVLFDQHGKRSGELHVKRLNLVMPDRATGWTVSHLNGFALVD